LYATAPTTIQIGSGGVTCKVLGGLTSLRRQWLCPTALPRDIGSLGDPWITRGAPQILMLADVLVGEPDSTSPGHAPGLTGCLGTGLKVGEDLTGALMNRRFHLFRRPA
jgi:hypothetical protein